MEGGGATVSKFFITKNLNLKKQNFFLGGGGGGARVSEIFYKESKSKLKK